MPTLKEVREKFPQYDDWNDAQLADALHRKFYSDMPREEFNTKIGFSAPQNKHLSFEEGQRLLEQENQSGASGAAGAGMTGFIEGMPIVGPILMGGAKRAAAGISSLIDGESYDENLKQAQNITQTAQDAHPYVSTAGNVAGAVAGTLPLVAAAPAAFGAGSSPIGLRSLISGFSGAGLGGTDAAVRSSGDADAIKRGTAFGGATGLAGPLAGKVIGAGAQKIWNAITNRGAAQAAGTTSGAVKELSGLLEREGMDASAVRQALAERGPDGMVMDIAPGLQGRAGGIAAIPGEGQATIREALAARQAGANDRIRAAVDDTMGPNIVPSEVREGIEANQQALSPWYREVFDGTGPYDSTPIADALDDTIRSSRGGRQEATRDVRRMLNTYGTDQPSPDPRVLFETRQAIDGMRNTSVDPRAVAAFDEARGFVDDGLRAAVPGIKEPDAAFAELARQKDALARGQTVLDHGRTAPRPAELAREVQEGALPQGLQIGPSAVPLRMSQGARAEVERILGSNANDVQALYRTIKSEGDWNRDRLATLFGQEKADRLFRVLENERAFADTNQIVTRNSETSRRLAAMADGQRSEPDLVKQAAAAGGIRAVPRALAIKAGDKVINALMAGRKEASEAELAKLLSTNRSAVADALALRESLPSVDPKAERIAKALLLGGGVSGSR